MSKKKFKIVKRDNPAAIERSKYCVAIIYALRYFGGTAHRKEVLKFVKRILNISKKELSIRLPSGVYRVDKDIDYARLSLKLYDFVCAPEEKGCKRGYWKITKKGLNADLDNLNFKSLIYQLDIKGYKGNSKLLKMKK